jgi:hypothetical protein
VSLEDCQKVTERKEGLLTIYKSICDFADWGGLLVPTLKNRRPEGLLRATLKKWTEPVAPKPLLVYLKNNPIREYHAAGFNMDQKHCNSFIHVMHHILKQCLRDADVMPADSQKEFEKLLKARPVEEGLPVLLHDGTEREIPRPVDRDEQHENYSGKKKKHTVRNAVITTACCLILFVSPTVCGKMHDKKIAGTLYSFSCPCLLYQDTGYQGYNPEGVSVYQPIKKPRGRELAEEEKAYNRKISSFRVRVEHATGSVRHMRIVRDECRLRADGFVQQIFRICAALHNFRIKINTWHYEN